MKVLVISHDKVGPSMAGPGMRYHQIALELSKTHDVTLATFNPAYLEGLTDVPYSFTDIKTYDFQPVFKPYDAIVALWLSNDMIDYAKSQGIKLIFDLYAPVPVENMVGMMFTDRQLQPEDDYNYIVSVESYKHFMTVGDFFMCSNNSQKDFWTGFGFATSSILPSNYNSFPLYDRIGICAMGTNLNEIKRHKPNDRLRQAFPSIKPSDFVLIWTGGIWDWFDAVTPIKAMAELNKSGVNNVKLVFLATKHPNKDVPEMSETAVALRTAKKLGLLDKSVFFLEGWIDYDKRLDYFTAADAALYAHKPSIEARFSHRTRVLDHLLAGLPTIATAGDYFADVIERDNLGITVEPTNVDAMAKAIKDLLVKSIYSSLTANVIKVRADYAWSKTLQPLVKFLADNPPVRQAVKPVKLITASSSASRIKRAIPRPVKEAIKRLRMKARGH